MKQKLKIGSARIKRYILEVCILKNTLQQPFKKTMSPKSAMFLFQRHSNWDTKDNMVPVHAFIVISNTKPLLAFALLVENYSNSS